jgi:hypothetical protein
MANKRFNKQVPGYGYKSGGQVNTRRENRLEELGRVDAEGARTGRGRRNLSDEKKRIIREIRSAKPKTKAARGEYR